MLKTALLTSLALIAFAANSVLCRLALAEPLMDAASFTVIRLLSGALVLFLLLVLQQKPAVENARGSWSASVMLFVYAAAFSYAYISLDTATGALILFGSVQVTMVLKTMWSGYRLNALEWSGLILAFVGFAYLMLPSVSTPSLVGFVLMLVSGIAWGLYTLQGRDSKFPLWDTAYNFIRTIPMVVVLLLCSLKQAHFSDEGIFYAVLSGAVASGLGYTIWYMALVGLVPTQAAVLQLLVPILAALGGVMIVDEPLTQQFIVATALVLSGTYLVIKAKQ